MGHATNRDAKSKLFDEAYTNFASSFGLVHFQGISQLVHGKRNEVTSLTEMKALQKIAHTHNSIHTR